MLVVCIRIIEWVLRKTKRLHKFIILITTDFWRRLFFFLPQKKHNGDYHEAKNDV